MYIYQLVLEITRRCNSSCPHCLRGPTEDLDISNQVIDTLLKEVSHISTITFTGGEPTLAVDRIRYFFKKAKEYQIPIENFYVVTNGKFASRALARTLLDINEYCQSFNDCDVISSLCISGDQFHEKNTMEAQRLYSGLSFFNKEERQKNIPDLGIINEGYALENGLGYREAFLNDIEINKTDSEIRCEGTLYINAKGEVCTSCDLSYESQKENSRGNILERSLTEIINSIPQEE